jgi:hypothetical protein
MVSYVAELAAQVGALDKIVVVHCDLGRVEWSSTRELAELHARHYGLPFEVRSRQQGDLLQQVEERGMRPSASVRYCTAYHKRDLVRQLIRGFDDRYAGFWRRGAGLPRHPGRGVLQAQGQAPADAGLGAHHPRAVRVHMAAYPRVVR